MLRHAVGAAEIAAVRHRHAQIRHLPTERVNQRQKKLLATKVAGGLTGSFGFDANGDTTATPVTIYEIKGGKAVVAKVVAPSAALVR